MNGSGTGYLKTVCDYVHLNPARAKLLKINQPLRTFAWSSWPLYLMAPSKRPAWLFAKGLLGEHGIPKDSTAGRRELERRVEAQRLAEETGEYKKIRRGWCLGGDQFRKELLAHMTERLGPEHYGAERLETQTDAAERILAEELDRRKWTEDDLRKRPKIGTSY